MAAASKLSTLPGQAEEDVTREPKTAGKNSCVRLKTIARKKALSSEGQGGNGETHSQKGREEKLLEGGEEWREHEVEWVEEST